MRRSSRTAALAILGPLLTLALSLPVEAATLRSPQIVFQGAALQAYLNGVDGPINVNTDQVENAAWIPTSPSCNTGLVIGLLDTTGVGTVGLYSTSQPSPTLLPLFPSGARAGWFCAVNFISGFLHVSLFDQTNTFVSQTTYSGLDLNHIGWYMQGPAGTWYTEDARNGGKAQVLSFQSVDFPGAAYLCFQRSPYDPAASTFASEVVQVVPNCEDPVLKPTWGQLKARYR